LISLSGDFQPGENWALGLTSNRHRERRHDVRSVGEDIRIEIEGLVIEIGSAAFKEDDFSITAEHRRTGAVIGTVTAETALSQKDGTARLPIEEENVGGADCVGG